MSDRSIDVLGLGVIAVDDMLYAPFYPPANAKVRLTGRRRLGGGTMSCALAAAAKLGSRCVALGRLGEDDQSAFVWKHLADAGVDLSLIVRDPEAGPVHTTIVVAADTGSRAIFGDYSAARPLAAEELRPEWFADARVLMIDHFNGPSILAGVRLAKQAGCQVVSDIERPPAEFPEIRRHIDHLVCSAEFSMPFTGTDRPEAACAALAAGGAHRCVVVTGGERGCFWSENAGPVRHLPAHVVKPVDTTGCGDVFHGVYCHGLAAGWPLERVLAYANAGAGIKATRTGGWWAVPTSGEIEHMLGFS